MPNQIHTNYPSGSRRQPPQLLDPRGAGFCISGGERISHHAPIRPFCLQCWGRYRHMPAHHFRTIPQRYCHRCGTTGEGKITYGHVHCIRCEAELVHPVVA